MVMKTIVHVLLIAAFATVPSRADKDDDNTVALRVGRTEDGLGVNVIAPKKAVEVALEQEGASLDQVMEENDSDMDDVNIDLADAAPMMTSEGDEDVNAQVFGLIKKLFAKKKLLKGKKKLIKGKKSKKEDEEKQEEVEEKEGEDDKEEAKKIDVVVIKKEEPKKVEEEAKEDKEVDVVVKKAKEEEKKLEKKVIPAFLKKPEKVAKPHTKLF